jgi:Mitochondrial pyruvate carriers
MLVSTRLLQQQIGRQQQRLVLGVTTVSTRSFIGISCKNYLQTTSIGSRISSSIRQTKTSPITSIRTTIRQQSTDSSKSTNGTASNKEGLWNSASFWGGLGALAGWGMSGSAIYDAFNSGPEIISLSMTPVLIVYSSLFARWAWIVQPQNLLLCSCHIANILAQCNQLYRVIDYKYSIGQTNETNIMVQQIAVATTVLIGGTASSYYVRPFLQKNISPDSNLSILRTIALADAGPFTVHFWAPLSKWLISGASFLDLHRPTDKISIAQYSALTATGFFFTRYALLVKPVNYMLCAVNFALFTSSAWHLGRKINADYNTSSTK